MRDQKAENLLNLALSVPEEEREKTEELNVGFDKEHATWELIVTYSGNLRGVLEVQFPEVKMRELLGEFAILTVPENQVEAVINIDEIEYVEKPKRLYFVLNQARAASCFLPVQSRPGGGDGVSCIANNQESVSEGARIVNNRSDNLTGCGVLVGILDSGIDYFHEDFRNEDGSSRILFLYDQVLERVFTNREMNDALESGNREEGIRLVPSTDASGHGTAVAGIAAGNGRESGGRYRGAAYQSELIVVKLGMADPNGFPKTTKVMDGLDFVVRTAMELGRPIAVNLSFGNTYGSHDGNGLFERYIDQISEIGRSVFVIGTGNEGDKAGHVSGILKEDDHSIELSAAPYETGFGVQLWKNYVDEFEVFLSNPAGTITERISGRQDAYEINMGGTSVLVYYGEPGPFLEAQEIYFDFLPAETYVESGIWKFLLRPVKIIDGRYDFWLPSAGALNRSTRFLRPTPETTLTIPSTALRAISVGAYDDSTRAYAPFSGRGDTRIYKIQKPDLVAPGVGIIAPQRGGGYAPVTGTSFAAPLVTGASALLMEWGIVKGNDRYLYGDKVKAYLKKGARPLSGEQEYPNPRVGWGALCVNDSLPDKL